MIAKKFLSLVALLSLPFGMLTNVGHAAFDPATPESRAVAPVSFTKNKLRFEENRGQTDRVVRFISRAAGYNAFFAENEVVFQLKYEGPEEIVDERSRSPKAKIESDNLRMKFSGGRAARVSGADELVMKTNFYHHRTRLENIANYGRVNYGRLYEGIDAVFYGTPSGALEYDFNVAPNADVSQIRLDLEGAKSVTINEDGNLVIKTANTELIQNKPFAYQMIGAEKHEVKAEYVVSKQSEIADQKSQISFALGEYDKNLPLVIDPVVDYLTYIGGTAGDDVFEVAADAQGNAYISGETSSLNFHGQTRQSNDGSAAYVAKINSDGSSFVYLTILEGNSNDLGSGLALAADNSVHVVGQGTQDFPVTDGAFDTNLGSPGDGFAAKLDPNGILEYATYIGGNAGDDVAFDVAVDSSGKAYVAGRTLSGLSFPQKNRYQGCGAGISTNSYDAYLTVLNASGSDITYSTCIGGNLTADHAFSIALDASNNAYLTGLANGGNFPVKNAFQPNSGGGTDAWVAKFNPAASGEASLIYSTYLGGVGTDQGNGIAVDSLGQAVIVGLTGSVDFPLANAFDATNQINEGFVTVLSPSGTTLAGSSFIGGADKDQALNVAVGKAGTIFVTGNTVSNDFPMALPFQATRRGVRDAFVTKLRFGTGIMSSSYLGGSGNDTGDGIAVSGNHIFVVGQTESNNLLTTGGTIKETSTADATNDDGFVAKILDTHLDSVGVFRPSSVFTLTQSITNVIPANATFTGALAGQVGVSGDWDGDSIDSIGTFTNGTWKVRNSNFPQVNLSGIFGAKTITFGQTGDLPVVGDWNNDGIDTPGVFRPSTGQFLLTNSTSTTPAVEITLNFGLSGDLPVAGDWNADGLDTIGVFRPSTGQFFLTDDSIGKVTIDQSFFFGANGDLPVGGDWNGDGIHTIGVYRPSTTEYFLTNDNITFSNVFTFGQINDQPIAGDWDGRPN